MKTVTISRLPSLKRTMLDNFGIHGSRTDAQPVHPPTTARRIHIIGGPGSGKSTLGRLLGSHLGVPVYNLDKIAFVDRLFTERPRAVQRADVYTIASQPTWIAEGIFLDWTDELLRAADIIIWLDNVSWYTAVKRIVWRFAQGGLAEAKRQPGRHKFTRFNDYARNLRQLVGVLRFSRAYYHATLPDVRNGKLVISRAATIQCLAPYRHKVTHCCSADDVNKLVESLL